MSADNYMLVRKCVPSGRWHVTMLFMSDDSPPPAPKVTDEFFSHVEDALREAASHESEYGIFMGDDVSDPKTVARLVWDVIYGDYNGRRIDTSVADDIVHSLLAAGLLRS